MRGDVLLLLFTLYHTPRPTKGNLEAGIHLGVARQSNFHLTIQYSTICILSQLQIPALSKAKISPSNVIGDDIINFSTPVMEVSHSGQLHTPGKRDHFWFEGSNPSTSAPISSFILASIAGQILIKFFEANLILRDSPCLENSGCIGNHVFITTQIIISPLR